MLNHLLHYVLHLLYFSLHCIVISSSSNSFYLITLNDSDKNGYSTLIATHSGHDITAEKARHWLEVMDSVVDELFEDKRVSLKDMELLKDYFHHTAYYLVAAHEVKEEMSQIAKESNHCSKNETALKDRLFNADPM
jgi:hypothetical protein